MNVFERYLSLWVAAYMVLGVAIGKLLPGLVGAMHDMEFGTGSHINIPIAILIWLTIYPMMLKIDFAQVRGVGRRPAGLGVTLVVNWLVKPFLDGLPRLALLPPRVHALDRPRAGERVHRGCHHPGRGAVHGDGVRLVVPLGRGSRVHPSSRWR